MKTPLPVTPVIEAGGLDALVQEILRIADPENIFLLSAGYDYQLTENIFLKNPVQSFRANRYHLLILFERKMSESLKTKEAVLNSLLNDRRNLQLEVMDINDFNARVEAGDAYFGFILRNAMIWYDKGRIPLVYPKLP
jgi:hypothetical protein